jgi:hypothetical protein
LHTTTQKPDPKTTILDAFFSNDAPLVQKSPKVVTGSPSILQQQPQIIYVVPAQQMPQQRRVVQQNLQPQRNQGFDFLKEEKKEDSHFDFIKQEMAQKVQK